MTFRVKQKFKPFFVCFLRLLLPAKYCKQLYLDVTNTNNGKITWNYIKPIIQGKFLYGPINPQTKQIIQNVSFSLLNNSKFINLNSIFTIPFVSFRLVDFFTGERNNVGNDTAEKSREEC